MNIINELNELVRLARSTEEGRHQVWDLLACPGEMQQHLERVVNINQLDLLDENMICWAKRYMGRRLLCRD